MLFEQLISTIENIANPALQADWDRSGLQVFSRRNEFRKTGIFLDPTPTNITKALDGGADFLVSHHPLSLVPRLPNKLNNYYEALSILMKADVPLYAAHTSLDVNIEGPAGWIGRALRLHDIIPLVPLPAHPSFGYGFVGILQEPLPIRQLEAQILSLLDLDWLVASGNTPECIQKIAICGGSGASLIEKAEKAGVDLYITGDVKYHSALDAQVPLWDVGHHSLEEKMMADFALVMAKCGLDVILVPSQSPFALVRPGAEQVEP